MSENKIILNYLPPATIYYPSSSLSILKSFLQTNNFSTEIKYWNFLLNSIITEKLDEEITDIEIKLMPFNAIFAEEYNDNILYDKILAYLYKTKPGIFFYEKDGYKNYIEQIKTKVRNIINTELDKIDFKNVLLFGISYKFYQWIPGIILANEVKKRSPETKIVMGGFEHKHSAELLLNICKSIDFAIWGEGEYPLLDLCNCLNNKQNSYNDIARLIYRSENKIINSETTKGNYLDFQNYIFPDYSDYMHIPQHLKEKSLNFFPVNSIRSCNWKRCKFCNYSQGYKYRERQPQSIVDELEYMHKHYGANKFMFVDNDTIGTNIERFEELLNIIIATKQKLKSTYTLWCEMIPHKHLTDEIIKKMAAAGFKEIFIGYEGISDSILKKMDKSNDFADNIFIVKSALKHGISVRTNLIKGIPDETKSDVLESINNLNFLRFFFHTKPNSLNHDHGPFALQHEAKYFKTLSADEIKQYDRNPTSYYVSESLVKSPSILFGNLKRSLDNVNEWYSFSEIESLFRVRVYTYKIKYKGKNVIFYEYINGKEVNAITFFELEYIAVLKETNHKVISIDLLFIKLSSQFPTITQERLKEVLTNLKDAYLLYFNVDFSSIVSVINIVL